MSHKIIPPAIGFKLNRLTLLAVIPKDGGALKGRWACECGSVVNLPIYKVVSNKTKSCGCFRREATRARGKKKTTHGKSNIPEYHVYHAVLARCTKPTADAFYWYGQRGIKICERWLGHNGFENFFSDMGPRPSKDYSIERLNNNGDYSPDNCVWATRREQSANRRNTIRMTILGKSMCQAEFARMLGVSEIAIEWWRKKGMTPEQIRDHFAQRKAA